MKIQLMLNCVRSAIEHAKFQHAEFGNVPRYSEPTRLQPIRNNAGEIVTEANVTAFIRERVRTHHNCWIIGALETVERNLQSELSHRFEADLGVYSFRCVYCHNDESHRSHKK